MPDGPLDVLATQTISRDGLTAAELQRELEALGPRWQIIDGELRLTLRAKMARTSAAAAFAGTLADELDHHPRIAIDHAQLVLTIHTHDARAITVLDLVFAARLEQWLRAEDWPT